MFLCVGENHQSMFGTERLHHHYIGTGCILNLIPHYYSHYHNDMQTEIQRAIIKTYCVLPGIMQRLLYPGSLHYVTQADHQTSS